LFQNTWAILQLTICLQAAINYVQIGRAQLCTSLKIQLNEPWLFISSPLF
jgi:hypothetical protein